MKQLEKAKKLRASSNAYPARTSADYEAKALSYEKQGQYDRAQRNREKVWRLQNTKYGNDVYAPQFYGDNNKFLGYNLQPSTTRTTTYTTVVYGGSSGAPSYRDQFGVFSRDPAKYEAKAAHYRQLGNEKAVSAISLGCCMLMNDIKLATKIIIN